MKINWKGIHMTLFYTGVHVLIGMAIGLLGPTLPRMAELLGENPELLGFVFVTRGIGWMASSFAAGFIYDKVRRGHLVLVTFIITLAVASLAIPFSAYLNKYLWAALFAVLGIGGGAADLGINTLLSWVHGADVAPHFQFLHFGFGFGALLSPVIVGGVMSATGEISWSYWSLAVLCVPFIILSFILKSPAHSHSTVATPAESAAVGLMPDFEVRTPLSGTRSRRASLLVTPRGTAAMHFATPRASFDVARSTPRHSVDVARASVDLARSGAMPRASTEVTPTALRAALADTESAANAPENLLNTADGAIAADEPSPVWLIMLLALLLFFYVGAEVGYGGWLSTYAIDRGLADPLTAPYLNTAFFGAITLGRLLGVPLSLRLSPLRLLAMNMGGSLLATVLLVALAPFAPALWACSVLYGLFMGSIWATAATYPTSLGRSMTARHMMYLVVGSSTGEMAVPFVMAPLFDRFGYWLLPLCLVATTVLQLSVLLVLWRITPRLLVGKPGKDATADDVPLLAEQDLRSEDLGSMHSSLKPRAPKRRDDEIELSTVRSAVGGAVAPLLVPAGTMNDERVPRTPHTPGEESVFVSASPPTPRRRRSVTFSNSVGHIEREV